MNPQPKNKTYRSAKYRKFVASQPCIICCHKAECHHIRQAGNAGTGIKPSDLYGLPLCRLHHSEAHHFGIDTFFERHGIDVYEELFKMTKKWIEQGT